MNQVNSLRYDGFLTFYSISEWTDRVLLQALLSSIPCNDHAGKRTDFGAFMPDERTDLSCLKDALGIMYPKHLIRLLEDKKGYAVLTEDRRTDEVLTTTIMSAAVDYGVVSIRYNYDSLVEQRLVDEFRKQKLLLSTSQVGQLLVHILGSHIGVLTLRERGGLYWIPEEFVSDWRKVGDAIGRASTGRSSKIYLIGHVIDEDSLVAVKDALIREVESKTNTILAEVESNELGERALMTRANQAERLHEQIKFIENVLGETLTKAHALAEQAQMTADGARIMAVGAA